MSKSKKPKPKKTKIDNHLTAWESACELARDARAARQEYEFYHFPIGYYSTMTGRIPIFPKRPR